MSKNVLGHIDCPTCAHPKGMRITHDKNGDPFGFCEADNCGQQLRVGGKPARVRSFVNRYPWAAKPGAATVTVTEHKQPEPVAATVVQPVPEAKPARPASIFDTLYGDQ